MPSCWKNWWTYVCLRDNFFLFFIIVVSTLYKPCYTGEKWVDGERGQSFFWQYAHVRITRVVYGPFVRQI